METQKNNEKKGITEGITDTIFQFRLEATRDAQKMSRIAFLVSTIVALAIFITTWNAYYSWNVHFPLQEKWHESEVTEEVQRQIIKEWVESSFITVPILGIKVGIFDGSVFGSIALLIISVWFFLSIRRENHVIGFLLRDTKEKGTSEERQEIYHGIASYMLFANITKKDQPIEDLNEKHREHRLDSLMRMAFKILVFLPSFVIAFLIISDILTVYILPAYYRFPHNPLFEYFRLGDAIKLTVMEGLAFVLLVLITIICWRILSYVGSTTMILRQYYNEYTKDISK
jgi:hypothetical protein